MNELKLRAARRMGEISRELETSSGKRTDLQEPGKPELTRSKKAILRDAGLSKVTAAKYEKIAAMADDDFEALFGRHLLNHGVRSPSLLHPW